MTFEFREVPPPAKAPIDEVAAMHGLPNGLRVYASEGGCRCANCSTWQNPGAPMVWVPDSVQPSDSRDSVTEQARLMAFNGCSSGWCLSCAKSLGRGDVLGIPAPYVAVLGVVAVAWILILSGAL